MRWSVTVATGVAVLALAGVAGCVDSTSPSPPGQSGVGVPGAGGGAAASPTTPPKSVNTAEALKTANKEFELLAEQDWAGAWALWTRDAQKEVPRQEFVTANRTCPVSPGKAFALVAVVPVSDTLIELNWRREGTGAVGRGALILAGGEWYFQPDAQTLSEYASGAAKTISNRRENGTCGG